LTNINEPYFFASFRSTKQKPSDFGLKEVEGKDYYLDKNNNKWKNEYLWDNGWGNEYGFVRLPELSFSQLWNLLMKTKIQNNQLGASEFLNRKYPFELKERLKELFSSTEKINRKLTKRLSLLEVLNNVTNISDVYNKSPEEVRKDYEEWKKLKSEFDKLKTENFWRRIKKL
jgi:hypothetical protein